ncbi:hypothetical protein H0H81_006336 [Sphagnurus paluster]|uniref:Uncharacterized protein n=1 Tax=Sphagnurus paluster TaxID=117069 RepID=A0A9P7FX90_9AGAR|nr:hypothetical protein H0H81_006336 [Sphagnurus paluster]
MANRMRGAQDSEGLLTMALNCDYEDGGAVGKERDAARGWPCGPLAVWTTGVWEKEAVAMRWCEKKLVDVVSWWTTSKIRNPDTSPFVREVAETKAMQPSSILVGLIRRLTRS